MKDTAEKLATKWTAAERQYRDQVREAMIAGCLHWEAITPPDRIRAGGQRKR